MATKRSRPGREPSTFGKALKNRVKNKRAGERAVNADVSGLHTTDADDETSRRGKLMSRTDRNELDEFLVDAMLREQEFVAEKEHLIVMGTEVKGMEEGPRTAADIAQTSYEIMQIPRRPKWTKEMSASELDRLEREAFLQWRRELAQREEKSYGTTEITPFEKNIEVWRQLWRVVERSEVVAQIVDARNPLFFRSEDLEAYVREVDPRKVCVLIINKADYLSKTARAMWADYFSKQNIPTAFFSAAASQQKLDAEEKERRVKAAQRAREAAQRAKEEGLSLALAAAAGRLREDAREGEEGKEEASAGKEAENEGVEEKRDAGGAEADPEVESKAPSDPTRILSRDELLDFLLRRVPPHAAGAERANIGMVGYPNVGKSSTINVLYTHKKTQVGATPGKTKHFQTLLLGDNICLCDCPGLVFPTATNSRASLVLNGVLPIDQLRDYIAPVELLTQLVHPQQFLNAYGLTFKDEMQVSAWDVLRAHAQVRGFASDHGRADFSRSSRILLKDYVKGKLLYCHPPPSLDAAGLAAFYQSFAYFPPKQLYELSTGAAMPSAAERKRRADEGQGEGEGPMSTGGGVSLARDTEDADADGEDEDGPAPVDVRVKRNRKGAKPLGANPDLVTGPLLEGEEEAPKMTAKEKRRAKERARKDMREQRKMGGRKGDPTAIPNFLSRQHGGQVAASSITGATKYF